MGVELCIVVVEFEIDFGDVLIDQGEVVRLWFWFED